MHIYHKREKVVGVWRRLHNEELHNFYTSLNIIRTIKSGMMGWVGKVPRTGEVRNTVFWVENLQGDHSEDLGVDGKIILKWILRGIVWKGFIWLRIVADGGHSTYST
jgi:hypothetical protein